MKRPTDLAIVASALCLLAVAACGQGDGPRPRPSGENAPGASPSPRMASPTSLLAPTPTPAETGHGLIYPPATVSPSLEEQIFSSDTIVLTSLVSVSAGAETVPSDPGVAPTYRAVNELRFTVHEYLKGSGPTEILVVVRDEHTYPEESDALAWAQRQLSLRKTDWDDRRGLLFVKTRPYQPAGAGRSTEEAFEFTLSNPVVQTPWDYSIDTLSRAWLPASDTEPAAEQGFITDGTASPPPMVSLSELRSQVAELEATLASGAGTRGFRDCIQSKILRERLRRVDPFVPPARTATLASGLVAGADVYRRSDDGSGYHRYRMTGPDAALFQHLREDTDADPANGYDDTIVTVRPLPEGVYRFQHHWQHYRQIPCDFFPDDAYTEWTVTVSAPSGTVTRRSSIRWASAPRSGPTGRAAC